VFLSHWILPLNGMLSCLNECEFLSASKVQMLSERTRMSLVLSMFLKEQGATVVSTSVGTGTSSDLD
jgi:hypothetical protein